MADGPICLARLSTAGLSGCRATPAHASRIAALTSLTSARRTARATSTTSLTTLYSGFARGEIDPGFRLRSEAVRVQRERLEAMPRSYTATSAIPNAYRVLGPIMRTAIDISSRVEGISVDGELEDPAYLLQC